MEGRAEKFTRKGANDLLQLISFKIEDEEYGVNILDVIEVIRLPQVKKLPKSPDFLKGIINLRGEVIPIVDLRQRFGLGEIENDDKKRTIIVKVEERKVGMIVDSVSKVIRVNAEEIKDPVNFNSLINSNYITGIVMLDERLIILLDIMSIFTREEIRNLSKVQEEHGFYSEDLAETTTAKS